MLYFPIGYILLYQEIVVGGVENSVKSKSSGVKNGRNESVLS